MALDLLVNFERYSNHSIFYRTVGTFPLSVKLAETNPEIDLVSNPLSSYDVALYINKSKVGSVFNPSNETTILTSTNFNTTSPCVCAISAVVFRNQQQVASFAMSAVFVSSFPTIDFVLHPLNYINETTQNYESIGDIQLSPGPFFYGEGHTETFFLSCNGFSNSYSAVWLVGNPIGSANSNSVFSVTQTPGNKFTATVNITSNTNDSSSYPVSIKLFNTQILSSGPVITYPDMSGGARSFYPFFDATTDPYGTDNSLLFVNYLSSTVYKTSFLVNALKTDPSSLGRTKGNIKVLQYEDYIPNIQSTFISPFGNQQGIGYALLPSNRSPKPFRGYLYNPRPPGIVNSSIVGSKFSIECASDNPDEYWSLETPLLSTIYAYQFNLTYDSTTNDSYLPPFYVSPLFYNTLTLNTSCIKLLQITLSGANIPTDWKAKPVTYTYTNKGIIGPIPFVKLYTPNFYYLRDQIIPITLTSLPALPYNLVKAVVYSDYSKTPLVLTPENLTGNLQIHNAGTVTLKVDLTVSDILQNTQETYTIEFSDFVKIVNQYDFVDESLFLTSLTPLKLTYSSQPRLSPNEWAIADNVNSLIEKVYTIIDDLDDYTKLYANTSKLYSWLGPVARTSVIDPLGIPQTWLDWTTNCTSWISLSSRENNIGLSWLYNTEKVTQKTKNPACLQDYCLSWRWEDRKTTSRNTRVTWKLSRLNKPYQKRWIPEKCEIDSELLNCNIGSWKTSSMDPESFPIPTQVGNPGCKIVSALYHNKTNTIVYANPTELHVLLNDAEATAIARRGIADERFSFQNIAGLAVSSEGRLVVLDSILCRISVLDVITKPSDLNLVISWGTYGSSDNPRGFNKPRDIHIDQNNSLWVTDTGNKRVKKLTIVGKQIKIFYDERFNLNPPISVCVDSKFNLHCLHVNGVYVFNEAGVFLFEYNFPADVVGVNKINTSYNRECIYITHSTGVVKYFRTGQIAYHALQNVPSTYSSVLRDYKSVTQDLYRNCYVTVDDKIIKVPDVQAIEETKAPLPATLYWPMSSLFVSKEEYIQPWVYLKSFHRLWDNIELIRSSLSYEPKGCKSYTAPIHAKEDLVIGQNEIVTNATINRLSQQLWENMQSIIKYFDPDCEN